MNLLTLEKAKKPMLFLLLQLWGTAPLIAHYDLDDINSESYQLRYNKLPSVEESDRLLNERSTQFSRLLEDAEKIVVKYEMEAHVGLRLIHSHFTLDKGQLMVESPQDFKAIPSLVTCAQTFEEAKQKKSAPASWIFSDNKSEDISVFETSTDPAVHTGLQMLQKKPEFLREMGDLLRETHFNSLLAVALLKRDSLVVKEEQIYMESNDADLKSSVVQVLNKKDKPEMTTRTSWSFKGPKQQDCLWLGAYCPLAACCPRHVVVK